MSSGKKLEVGDSAESVGSSHRIQSSNEPKLNESRSSLVSPLDRSKESAWKSTDSGEVGDVRVEPDESELISAGSV